MDREMAVRGVVWDVYSRVLPIDAGDTARLLAVAWNLWDDYGDPPLHAAREAILRDVETTPFPGVQAVLWTLNTALDPGMPLPDEPDPLEEL